MDDLIRPGDRSQEVADVQARLRAIGLVMRSEDGWFGPETAAAVRSFQQQRSLLVDGLVGPQTWSALVEASWRLGDRTLYVKRPYMRGDDVAALQRALNALGYDAGREDGIFGPLAYDAIKAFQKEYGIAEDGMYGPRTHSALAGLRVDRPGTAAHIREELRVRSRAGLHERVIVIDPAHGGADRGDVGPNGLREADVVWQISTLLAERLAAGGATIRLTRAEPESPDVTTRAHRANDLDADLFVSIHLNANEEPTAEGACTYFFGNSPAGEEAAERILDALVALGQRDCRSHARSYALLRETKMPAVLVEPAFITNPDEEKRLEDAAYRAEVAEAISVGIRNFFESEDVTY